MSEHTENARNLPARVALLGEWRALPAERPSLEIDDFTFKHTPTKPSEFRADLAEHGPSWLLLGEGLAEEMLSELASAARVRLPEIRLAAFGPEDDMDRCERWRRQGALVYLDAASSPERLATALRDSIILDVAMEAGCFDRAAQLRRARLEAASHLTPQELRVLRLVGLGLGNLQIAASLNLSENTVQFHMRNIFEKLGVTNRTQAAERAKWLGL